MKKFGASVDYHIDGHSRDIFHRGRKGEADNAVIPIETRRRGAVREPWTALWRAT